MSELFKSEFFTDEATVYNLKDSMWLGLPSKSNEWWFGVQNTGATDNERKEAAEFIANAINTHDTMQARIVELEGALCEISNMCIGNLTMSYSLDAQYIGELIYSATGLTNPELNEVSGGDF